MREAKSLHYVDLARRTDTNHDLGKTIQLAQIGEKWRDIISESSIIEYKPEQNVFYAGHYPSGIFVVLYGKLALVRQESRVRKIVREVPPFWAIGFDLLNSGETYPYDGVATGPLKVCFITKALVMRELAAG